MDAFMEGLRRGGAEGEVVFLPEKQIERCRQCDENGWGTCRTEGRCCAEDDFTPLLEQVRKADAVVMATPVYWGDLSESLRAFMDRMRRVAWHEKGKVGIAGKPAMGICVAGGGGGGAPSCCAQMERILQQSGMDVVEMVPARRQNLEMKLQVLGEVGRWFATGPRSR